MPRDVVIAIFSCPDQVIDARCKCDNIIEWLWGGRASEQPVVITVGNAKAAFAILDKNGEQFIGPVIRSNALKLKGQEPGRIALIGFSEGCNAFNRILKNKANRDQLDFVYACDGAAGSYQTPHQKWDDASAEKNINDIIFESINGLVAFAVEAAQPDPASGSAKIPKRCMVITTSQNAGRGNSARTKDTALRIMREVRARATSLARPCIIPTTLIGETSAGLDRPGETWPSQWNNCPTSPGSICRSDITDYWPVEKPADIIGNLIFVGFAANTEKPTSCGKLCSEPAHIFQNWWVHRQVWVDVLAPRWQIACVHETEPAKGPPNPQNELPPRTKNDTSGGGGAQTIGGKLADALGIPVAPSYNDPAPYRYSGLNPNTLIRRGPMTIVERPGALGSLEWCGVEGVFSTLFTKEEWQMIYLKALLPYFLIGGLAVGTAWYLHSRKDLDW
jgi:hypothetical protein